MHKPFWILGALYLSFVSALFLTTPRTTDAVAVQKTFDYDLARKDLAREKINSVNPQIKRSNKPLPTVEPKKEVESPKPTTSIPELKNIEASAKDNIEVIEEVKLVGSTTDYIMNKINEYRSSLGLSKVSTDTNTCSFARIRAEEISKSFNHDGFSSRMGGGSLPYSSYSAATENIAMNSDYKNVVDAWIASAGHAENMRSDTPFVCVINYGNYYAYEGWRP